MKQLILMLLVAFQFSYAQEGKIFWEEGKKLTWGDFKKTPPKFHSSAAITASGLSYGFSADINGGKVDVNYEVKAYFLTIESWVKFRFKHDEYLLAHEQLHFDITELYVRKFREQLKTVRFTEDVENEINAIYKPIAKDRIAMQKRYDAETDHSRNLKMQYKWKSRIPNKVSAHKNAIW